MSCGRPTRGALGLLLGLPLLCLASGCASIPEPERIPASRRLFPEAARTPFRLAIGEVEISLSVEERTKARVGFSVEDEDEDSDKYSVGEVVDYGALRREVSDWIEAGESFANVRVAEGESAEARRHDAWLQRDDLLLELHLQDFQTRFDGHNWLWIPNVINWLYWIAPAWFIATEEYSLELTGVARLRQISGGPVVSEVSVGVEVTGTLGEFQRGWQFFGPIYPSNGSENWRAIASVLWPAARAQLGKKLSVALRKASGRLGGRASNRELSKTLVLSVGISHYQDTVRLPTLPNAVQDAEAVGDGFARAAGIEKHQVFERHEAAATRAGVSEALAELRERAREGDTIVVYFAGYGARDAEGRARLLLNGPADQASLSFAELGELLAPIPGSKILLLDCGFDQDQARAVAGARAPEGETEIADLAKAGGCGVLSASGPGSALVVPGHLSQSLFAHCLVDGLSGLADRDRDGVLSFVELVEYTRRKATAESAFLGARPQRPRAAGGESFRLILQEETK